MFYCSNVFEGVGGEYFMVGFGDGNIVFDVDVDIFLVIVNFRLFFWYVEVIVDVKIGFNGEYYVWF